MRVSKKQQGKDSYAELTGLMKKLGFKSTQMWDLVRDAIDTNMKNGRRITTPEAVNIAIRKLQRIYEEKQTNKKGRT